MNSKKLVKGWFKRWENGNFNDLPITERFKHTSPYGTIVGKQNYVTLVADNKDKFLGYRFEIHDGLYEKGKACVRYTAIQGNFRLEVSEWYYLKDDLIDEIIAYYNIEVTITENRQISYPE